MKKLFYLIIVLALSPLPSHAGKRNPVRIIAKEPVTMMDLGIIRLNTSLSKQQQPGLRGATMGAQYNVRKGTIDIKVTQPVKKASKAECKKIIKNELE